MARIESVRENIDTAHLLSRPGRQGSKDEYWIGLLADSTSSDVSFAWSDGTATSRYIGQWKQGQPDHLSGSCTLVSLEKSSLFWKLNQCNILLPFLCELSGCLKGSFFCSSGGCISESKHCNGIDDCGDFSDELNCPGWIHVMFLNLWLKPRDRKRLVSSMRRERVENFLHLPTHLHIHRIPIADMSSSLL